MTDSDKRSWFVKTFWTKSVSRRFLSLRKNKLHFLVQISDKDLGVKWHPKITVDKMTVFRKITVYLIRIKITSVWDVTLEKGPYM